MAKSVRKPFYRYNQQTGCFRGEDDVPQLWIHSLEANTFDNFNIKAKGVGLRSILQAQAYETLSPRVDSKSDSRSSSLRCLTYAVRNIVLFALNAPMSSNNRGPGH